MAERGEYLLTQSGLQVQTLLDKVQNPATQPEATERLITAGGVQAGLALKYEKPSSGIPESDLNGNVVAGIVYDVSANNSGATFASLSALLSSESLSTLIPTEVRKGGMQLRFINSETEQYEQYSLLSATWSDNPTDWQGIDDAPTAGSDNLVKSGGVAGYVSVSQNSQTGKTELKIGATPALIVDNEPEAGSDNLVKSGGVQNELALGAVYDVSAKNPTAGPNNDGKWASLSALLSDANLNTLIPTAVRKGGMSIKFVLSSDNKYVQYRLMADAWSVDTNDWAIAEEGVYVENPEFVYVKTDAEDKILEATEKDGTKVFGGDVKLLGNMEVSGVSYKVIENPEYLAAWVDAEEKVIFGLKVDGKTYVGDADFLNDIKNNQEAINEIKSYLANFDTLDIDALSSITAVENPEFIEAKTDSEGKLLTGRTPDGAAFEKICFSTPKVSIDGHTIENIEDIEGRSEITTDSEGKIISYRDSDGVKHENVGMAVESIELSENAVSDLVSVLKSKGYGNVGHDMSDESYIQIAEPNLAVMNITNINDMPTSKTVNYHAIIEVWDGNGNYFKKKAIMNAQGNSSLSHNKKNFAVDWCEDDWEGDDTTSIKIGKWVSQDSHHFKAYYYDFFDGIPVIGYQWYNDIVLTRGVRNDRCWKRALLPSDATIGNTNVGMSGEGYDLLLDTGARCFPDGFPVIVHLNGSFYGIFCWQLKKHRDNYHQTKDNGKHIHLDGNICSTLLWNTNGTIDWMKWAGLTAESPEVLNYDGIEIRNPKGMILRNGNKYDFDAIHALGSSATVADVELVCDTDAEWDALVASADAKKLKALNYTNLVKKSLIALTEVITTLKTAEDNSETSSQIRELISTYFDVDSLIDFQIFSDVSANTDGVKKNWQWNTWDGSKWACSPYDLDWTFGLRGSYSDQEPLSAHIEGTNRSLPCYWIITYFNIELEARYAELRRMKIIDADYLAEKLNNWTLRVGFDNYKNELKKWPERRSDNIYRFRNWCVTSISNMDIIYNYNQN